MRRPPVFSVVGLGKMGMPLAVAFASRGIRVIGVDTAPGCVAALNGGRVPGPDAGMDSGLGEVIRANRDRLRGTDSYQDAVAASCVTFVVVPTPSDSRGAYSLEYVEAAFTAIGQALAGKPDRHLVVLVSTVLPGSTRYRLQPALESASGKRCGPDLGLCYSPIFAALGSVMDDFLSPDFALIGELDPASGNELAGHFRQILGDGTPIKRMSLENAELAKLAVNSYVTMKITFANLLAAVCERIPGGEVDVVADAVGVDRRIGRAYLTGGLGYGGPCFPRDNNALRFLMERLQVPFDLPTTVDRLNRGLGGRLLDRLPLAVGPGQRVAVVGLSYKPTVAVLDESPGLCLAREVARRGARVVAFDPLTTELMIERASDQLDRVVQVAGSLEDCLRDADLVLLTTGQVPGLNARALKAAASPVTVVDFWRAWAQEFSGLREVRYLPVGCAVPEGNGVPLLKEMWSG